MILYNKTTERWTLPDSIGYYLFKFLDFAVASVLIAPGLSIERLGLNYGQRSLLMVWMRPTLFIAQILPFIRSRVFRLSTICRSCSRLSARQALTGCLLFRLTQTIIGTTSRFAFRPRSARTPCLTHQKEQSFLDG